MSLESLAARHGAIPYNHMDGHGNIYVYSHGQKRWCGRIVPDGTLFHRQEPDLRRIFVPRSEADLQRIEQLIRAGHAVCERDARDKLGPWRSIEHLADLLEEIEMSRNALLESRQSRGQSHLTPNRR